MTLIGYARCSTVDQNVTDQKDRLLKAGCDPKHLFVDEGVSGKLSSRPEWDRCMDYLREGDTFVVTKLDRAGRSVKHLLELSEDLAQRGVAFRILDQGIDTSTPVGRMFYTVLAALAQFERELLIERTHEGLRTARASGKRPGRKPKLSARQQAEVKRMHADGQSIVYIAEVMKVSRPVIYRVLEAAAKVPT